jgi:hypothetical protein
MKINFNKKTISSINSVIELENFIKERHVYNTFICFNKKLHKNIQDKISMTEVLNFKGIKPFIKEFMGGESNRTIDFWLCRGYSEEESLKKVSELQSKSAKMINFDNRLLPSNIEYWVNRGFSNDEAVEKIRHHQTTFSLEKCIQKYGEIDGTKKWEDRQIKWINSLNKTKEIAGGFNNDSSSVDFFKNKFGDEWVLRLLSKLSYTEDNLKILTNIINQCKNIDDLCEYIKNNVNFDTLSELHFIFNSKLIQEIFNIDYETLKSYIINKLKIQKTKFGNLWFIDGFIFNSNGEYVIGKLLKNKGVEFLHNKKYPNSNMRYDFFLPKYNIYVEYFGLIKNLGWCDNVILDKYKRKMDEKILFCQKNNLPLIHDTKCLNIINKLKKII